MQSISDADGMDDARYIRRCLELAEIGRYYVAPNPMVGAVLVASDGRILAEGWHERYGGPHAEVNCFADAERRGVTEEEIHEATLYVSLEPCSHYGKTPPCAELIVRKRPRRIVAGMLDPNPLVSGRGMQMVQEAGIEAVSGVLEDECRALNKRFVCLMTNHRPYVILKWAQTRDGYMDINRRDGDTISYWITNYALKVLTHKWRGEEDAILVGWRTMKNDRPQLTTREYPGKDPQRFVMQRGDEVISELPYTPLQENVNEALDRMYQLNIQSVIVEGGKKTLERFLEADLWDEARILVGSQTWGRGLKAPKLPGIPEKTVTIDDNQLMYVRRQL